MSAVRRSLIFSFAQTYGAYLFGLVGTIVLSRLLTPEEFGVYAVGASIVMLINAVRDFGIGTFLVQEETLTSERLRSAFTIALAISLACAILLASAAPAIGAFYGAEAMTDVLFLLALNMLISIVSLPSLSLMRRDLQFDTLAAINLSASLAQFATVIALALYGAGPLSMAWATLAECTCRTMAAFACRPVPGVFRPSLASWRRIVTFGGYTTATALINVLYDALPKLVIGRVLGVGPVGLYGRASMVCTLPDRIFISALHPVALPALAEQVRAGRSLREPYLLALTHMSALLWPGLLGLILLADPVVQLLLGPQWDAVPPLVRLMALGSLSLFPAFMTFPMLVSLGRIRDTLWMSAISVPPGILIITVLSHFGIEAVAAAQIINAPLQVFVAITFIQRQLPIAWSDIFRAVTPSAIAALTSCAVPLLIIALNGFRFDLPLLLLPVAVIGAAAGWLAGLSLGGHPMMQEIRQALRFIGQAVRQRG